MALLGGCYLEDLKSAGPAPKCTVRRKAGMRPDGLAVRFILHCQLLSVDSRGEPGTTLGLAYHVARLLFFQGCVGT